MKIMNKNQLKKIKKSNFEKNINVDNNTNLKKIKNYYKKNKLLVMMIISTFMVVTLLLSTEIYDILSTNYEVGQVSNDRVRAPRKFINRAETEKIKESTANSIQNYYKIDSEATENIYGEVEVFFGLLEEERVSYKNYYSNNEIVSEVIESSNVPVNVENEQGISQEILQNTVNPTIVPYEIENKELLKILTDNEIIYLCEMELDNYIAYKSFVNKIIVDTLEQGIKSDSVLNTFLLVEDYIKKQNFNEITSSITYKIIVNFLKPNLIIDEVATEKAKNEAVAKVEPVYYLEGQTIVDEGMIITDEIYMALDDLGYIEKNITELIISYVGVILLNAIFTLFVLLYIYLYDKKYLYNIGVMGLVCTLYLIYTASLILLKNTWINYMPLYVVTYLFTVFLNKKLVGVMTTSLIFLLGNFIPITANEMLFLFLTTNMEILFVKILNEKNRIIFGATFVSLFFGIIYVLMFIVEGYKITEILSEVYIIPMTVFISIIFSFGVAPAFATTFGLLTNARLMDFTRPDQPLIRRLTMEASGTYQHSLVVANLSEEAALAIGANASLCRTASYYHDIGKLENPIYYGENQNGYNPHDDLNPIDSANIILNHTVYGQKLAREYKLPKEIINIIPQHHGSTKVGYFYSKAINDLKYKDKITDEMFTYKGEIPKSKESAIIMLADTVEAAVRSVIYKMNSFNEVEEFVTKLINSKIKEGQLLDSDLTFKDIEKIKSSFMQILKGMYHNRVEYPAKKEVKDEEE